MEKTTAGLLAAVAVAGATAVGLSPMAAADPPREICSQVSGNCFYGDPDIWEYARCNPYDTDAHERGVYELMGKFGITYIEAEKYIDECEASY